MHSYYQQDTPTLRFGLVTGFVDNNKKYEASPGTREEKGMINSPCATDKYH